VSQNSPAYGHPPYVRAMFGEKEEEEEEEKDE
jgi:hypothetical protein